MNQPARFMDVQPSFGASNPPPEVHAARMRVLDGQQLEGDRELVLAFCEAHFSEWSSDERADFDTEGWVQRSAEMVWQEMEDERIKVEQKERVAKEKKEERKRMQTLTKDLADVEIAESSQLTDLDFASRPSGFEPTSSEDDLERDLRMEFEAQWEEERMDQAREAVGAMKIVDDGASRQV
ncbi:MAG: hypothetical protein Q9207_000851 [Kuettlingeria erythrocarpa]